MKKRKHRPLFFIDIAVPRDVEPEVNNIENVYLYDIDDLKETLAGPSVRPDRRSQSGPTPSLRKRWTSSRPG